MTDIHNEFPLYNKLIAEYISTLTDILILQILVSLVQYKGEKLTSVKPRGQAAVTLELLIPVHDQAETKSVICLPITVEKNID